VRESLAHCWDETRALEVVNRRGFESLLLTEVGAARASLEGHLELGHALGHWHLDLRGEDGSLGAVLAVEGGWQVLLEAVGLGELGSEARHWHVLHRIAEATVRLHLNGHCIRAKAALSCELVVHGLLAVVTESLLRGESWLENWAVCAKCSHLVEWDFIRRFCFF